MRFRSNVAAGLTVLVFSILEIMTADAIPVPETFKALTKRGNPTHQIADILTDPILLNAALAQLSDPVLSKLLVEGVNVDLFGAVVASGEFAVQSLTRLETFIQTTALPLLMVKPDGANLNPDVLEIAKVNIHALLAKSFNNMLKKEVTVQLATAVKDFCPEALKVKLATTAAATAGDLVKVKGCLSKNKDAMVKRVRFYLYAKANDAIREFQSAFWNMLPVLLGNTFKPADLDIRTMREALDNQIKNEKDVISRTSNQFRPSR